jgi:hypothetical protein
VDDLVIEERERRTRGLTCQAVELGIRGIECALAKGCASGYKVITASTCANAFRNTAGSLMNLLVRPGELRGLRTVPTAPSSSTRTRPRDALECTLLAFTNLWRLT